MEYNGWTNWVTWNVALWIGNDEGIYRLARRYRHRGYQAFAADLATDGMTQTPDNASFTDSALDVEALDAYLADL